MKRICTTSALLLSIGLAAPLRAGNAGDSLAIAVPSGSSLSDVSLTDLAKYFREEKSRTPDGTKIVIGMRENGSPERTAALKGIYHMTDGEYQKYFLQATFTGAVQAAPKQVSGTAGVKSFLASNPGGISCLKSGDVDASVKVLKIDGKAPGDAGYPLSLK